MEIKHTKDHNISWLNTFNTNFKRQGLDKSFEQAEVNGYPYIVWNGWVFETARGSIDEADRLIMAEELPT